MLRKLFKQEDGQALTAFSLALVGLIGFIALVVDGGNAYAHKSKVQTAADAAAMAGAVRLAEGASPTTVVQVASSYAYDNGAGYVQVTLEGGNAVHVHVERSFPTFFASIFGIEQMNAVAESTAVVEIAGSAGNLLPMAVYDQEFQYGETYELFNETMEAPGAFGWVDWNGPPHSTPELVYRINHPESSGVWHVGDWVWSTPGLRPTPCVIHALQQWIGKEVVVPLYDEITGCGCHAKYHISGFGVFVITDVVAHCGCHGPRFRVYGYFVQKVIPNAGGGGTVDRGAHVIELLQ